MPMSDSDCDNGGTEKNIIKSRNAPKYCCINGCAKNSKNSPNTTFFRIPYSSERSKLWLKSIGREDILEKNVKVNSFCVCDAHFEKIHIQINQNRTRLSLKAVPTLNLNIERNNVETIGSSEHQHVCSSQSDNSVNDPVCFNIKEKKTYGFTKGRLNSSGAEVTMAGWTKDETFEFIKLYKSFPHLWNKNSDLYQNKYARENSLLTIMNHMGPEKFKTTQDVKIKIKNLRTTYHQVMKKMKRAEKEGYPYTPTLSWFNDFKEIMDAERLEPVKQEIDSDFSDDIIYAPSTSVNDINTVFIESMPNEVDEESNKEDSVPLKKIKLENENNVDNEPSFHEHFQEEGVVNDEFQMFANNIAEQLRQLPLDRALKMQLDIHQLVAAERTKLYKQSFSETN